MSAKLGGAASLALAPRSFGAVPGKGEGKVLPCCSTLCACAALMRVTNGVEALPGSDVLTAAYYRRMARPATKPMARAASSA